MKSSKKMGNFRELAEERLLKGVRYGPYRWLKFSMPTLHLPFNIKTVDLFAITIACIVIALYVFMIMDSQKEEMDQSDDENDPIEAEDEDYSSDYNSDDPKSNSSASEEDENFR